ncbi:threonine/serine exporter family protein [Endozoicomonas gorgoniicola]|uniref:Threonine/serine exporter family protein n=1 Tax=Endozoicomonas gorgoniicola TaxID=1234144 RepID=A0ABT3MYK9_9GAMM|nr:threonine/serine exporter family protein [Endozoicomonas gorgoniicola]MCW7554461.1 threonine/serine exporter family protein [Endozoicomonas gorgoniicola]
MTGWILLERCLWAAIAALGFATLFTVPLRAFWVVASLAMIGYALRSAGMFFGLNLVVATLIASCSIGILAIQAAHWVHTPTTVFMAPAVIPMVPGVFAYRTMMGLLEISSTQSASVELLSTTAHNGLTAGFTLLSLAIGVSLPSLMFRNKSVKEIRFFKSLKI